MIALGLMASLAVILFGGWGIGFLLLPGQRSICERAAHAWLLGAVAVSIMLGTCGTMLRGGGLLAVVTIACVAPGLLALRKMIREKSVRFAWPRPAGFLEWVLTLVLVWQCMSLARFAWSTALGWDGMMVWEIKARIAFANGGAVPMIYFSDASRAWSHPDYPLMLPLLETWVYLWIGESSQYWVRILFPFFYFAAVLLLVSGVAEATGKRWAGLLTGGMLYCVPFLTAGGCNAFTGYADFPLALFYLAAVDCFVRYGREAAKSRATLFAIYAGALPWIKQEGSYLWLFAMLIAGVELIRRGRGGRIVPMAIPGIVAIVGWKIVLSASQAIRSSDFMPVTAGNVVQNLSRIGTILRAVGSELGSIEDWSLLWMITPFALLWVAYKWGRGLSLQLAAFQLMPMGFYSGIYILSALNPYQDHIANSLPRLVSDVSLVALMTIGLSVGAISERRVCRRSPNGNFPS